MKPIPIAVVGAGHWGRNLIRNLQHSTDFVLIAICDIVPARLIVYPAIETETDLHELLRHKELQAIVVATPPPSHAAIVRDALRAGKHVLCEKPLALTTNDCRELSTLALIRNLRLMVDCTSYYLEEIRTAHKAVPWNRVQEIECVRISTSSPASLRELLWDLAPHDLAILRGWLGKLTGHWTLRSSDSKTAILNGRCEGKPLLTLTFGSGPASFREITICGDFPTLKLQQRQTVPEPLKVVLDQFAECIRDGSTPPTDADGAVEAAMLLDEAFSSSSLNYQPKDILHIQSQAER